FDKEKLFSGNIDARKIKQTAEIYGFSYKTDPKKTQDGYDLLKIKTNRNDLAHGFKSFEEVGRDASADELLQIKKRVICYLREILQNIETYISKQEYLK
ncbi:MAG: MAE_28990/MAE_18760 family HEPN-like nuclease, partial [Xenococcaceae cyanobacterium MO_188.B29]|nr:MAE_28990/MAE_18760 family HEPN-like nuclease [Xenococcaceae cyanobacterium MO_188.B29]